MRASKSVSATHRLFGRADACRKIGKRALIETGRLRLRGDLAQLRFKKREPRRQPDRHVVARAEHAKNPEARETATSIAPAPAAPAAITPPVQPFRTRGCASAEMRRSSRGSRAIRPPSGRARRRTCGGSAGGGSRGGSISARAPGWPRPAAAPLAFPELDQRVRMASRARTRLRLLSGRWSVGGRRRLPPGAAGPRLSSAITRLPPPPAFGYEPYCDAASPATEAMPGKVGTGFPSGIATNEL